MKYLYNFAKYNEAIVTVDSDIISDLNELSTIITDDPDVKHWIDLIVGQSGRHINLDKMDNTDNYLISPSKENDGKYYSLTSRNRKTPQNIRISKSLKMLVPDIPERILTKIVSSLMIFKSDDFSEIEVLRGYDIIQGFSCDSIVNRGDISTSCMVTSLQNGEVTENIFGLYIMNDNISMVVLYNEDREISTRALLFEDIHGTTHMSRIYSSDPEGVIKIKKWAIENNIELLHEHMLHDVKISLEHIPYTFPFVDYINILNITKKTLSSIVEGDGEDVIIKLNKTDGSFDSIRNGYPIDIEDLDIRDFNNVREGLIYTVDSNKYMSDYKYDLKDNCYSYPDELFSYIDMSDLPKALDENNIEYDEDELYDEEDFIRNLFDEDSNAYESIVDTIIDNHYSDYNFEDIMDQWGLSENEYMHYYSMSDSMKNYVTSIFDTYKSNDELRESIRKIDYNELLYIFGLI